MSRRWLIRILTALAVLLVGLGIVGWARRDFFAALATTQALIAFSALLIALAGIAWWRSNHAEATPNAEELEMLQLLVERDFARQVARTLIAAPESPSRATVDVAHDPAWRRLFLQRLELHQELYALSRRVALGVYSRRIDDAVRRELAALRPPPGESPAGPPDDGRVDRP